MQNFISQEDLPQYFLSLEQLLTKKLWTPFFYIDQGEVYTEKDIVNSKGNTWRVDRLIVKEKEVWIVDYKSSEVKTGIQEEQVRKYRRLLKKIYGHKKVRGFLIYLDHFSVKEVDE